MSGIKEFMGIEPGWVKKINFATFEIFNKFFLIHFGSNHQIQHIHQTYKPGSPKNGDIGHSEVLTSNSNNCNTLTALCLVLAKPVSIITIGGTWLKKRIHERKVTSIFWNRYRFTYLRQVLKSFSFSFVKNKYPQSWINIFVHLFEKSNLSIRSDNNTRVSSLKILQTTTI